MTWQPCAEGEHQFETLDPDGNGIWYCWRCKAAGRRFADVGLKPYRCNRCNGPTRRRGRLCPNCRPRNR